MNLKEIARLREIALRATEGEWRAACHTVSTGRWEDKGGVYTVAHASRNDAEYISAVQPRVVLDMLRELELAQIVVQDKEV